MYGARLRVALPDDVDPVEVERVVLGAARVTTLRPDHRRYAFAELRERGLTWRAATARLRCSPDTTRRLNRQLGEPAPEPAEWGRPLTRRQRRAVLDVARGVRPLGSLPEPHRWIPVHACRAEGLDITGTARRLRASKVTVRRYLADPGEDAAL